MIKTDWSWLRSSVDCEPMPLYFVCDNYVNTLSLYSSFIMQQLKKVGGSCGGMLRTLVIVRLV